MTDPGCSMAELHAVLLARDLRDGEKAIVGTNSDVQVAACNLARCRQAPTLWWVSGPGGMVNCNEPVIRSTARTENIAWSEAMMDLPQMVDFIDWKIHFLILRFSAPFRSTDSAISTRSASDRTTDRSFVAPARSASAPSPRWRDGSMS